ncbi:MAG: lipopolysaccharide heptosyltransferase II [Deltaproteobacteria bacterium]|nr:MAG: lipopolysaccharide heptosyltransferase II [Deltaproteobacteria bacterium]
MNILIVKLSALGDVVQTIPTFEALRKQYPTAHIVWLVEEEAADLLTHYPGLDEVLVCGRRSWLKELRKPFSWPAVFLDVFRFGRRLRQRYYDVIIDLQGLLKSAIWVGLARGDRKIGFDRTREASWRVLNERLPAYDPDRHALERYLDVARYLGAEVDSVRVQDPWTPAEELQFQRRLERITENSEGPLVACHPISKWQSKLWPEEYFSQLTADMIARLRAKVVFTGGPEDSQAIARIISKAGSRGLFNWAGTTNLRELAFLYRHAAVVVSTDSGPMHLAAAVGTPVVALFGPTAPWRTGPYGEVHRVLRVDRDCSPCFQKTCDTVDCMAEIKVEDVFQIVSEQLNKE